MNGKHIFRGIVMFGAASCLIACLANEAQADNNDMVLQSHLRGKGAMQGIVQYVMHDRKEEMRTCATFLQGLKPGQDYSVIVRRTHDAVELGWVRSDKLGKAAIQMSTEFGHPIPYLRAGDVVEISRDLRASTTKRSYVVVMRGVLKRADRSPW